MLFLHFSDIHFRKTEVGQPDDPNKALRSDIIEDVKRMRAEIGRPAQGIWLTGDVAFAGQAEEYDFAYRWLEETLCPAAGCSIEDVFVIPGNHDVDRKVEAGPAPVNARQSLRNKPADQLDAEIGRWMRDKLSANLIFGPIENYNRFAAKFLCPLRAYIDGGKDVDDLPARPFATRDLILEDGSTMRLWGFNTVLVSDASDAENTMLVDPAAAQIEHEDGVCHVVMAHHPFNWIKNRRAFEDRCNRMAKIQLFGHEHTRRVEEGKRHLRIRAGAMHPEKDQPDWKPGYNWIDVSVATTDERRLNVQLWVRQYEVDGFLTVPDPDGKPVWENSFDLPKWDAPKPDAAKVVAPDGEDGDKMPEPQVMTTPTLPQPSVRSVTIKLFKLKEHEQRRLISHMKLDRPGDRDLKDYEIAIVAVKRSEEAGVLPDMDRSIDKVLAGETLA
ncbi:metallophosphoesterase [Bradyrhizobium sp. JYMT SZCCT0428]|uniref:metallophosphoesterase n=1 Tax=Bradyrhizobium sp. JYMT SZCCT0428 TaxID=2807673 RepID=UPI001BA97A07|nr:metallophosphoesterase [Bradyrhizobium sp. JYMT SZCCT0428]MBR1154619.1 metallophosphoesterase [Bradyrhizobium sp. JYMT SZCCT0428]